MAAMARSSGKPGREILLEMAGFPTFFDGYANIYTNVLDTLGSA